MKPIAILLGIVLALTSSGSGYRRDPAGAAR